MLNNFGSFSIFIIIFIISVIISLILIFICEFNNFKNIIDSFEELNDNTANYNIGNLSFEQFKNSEVEIIKVNNNLTLELNGVYEIFIPKNDIKKDVFIRDNLELIMLEPDKQYIFNNKIEIEAFYYGDVYEIYYKKIK